MRYTLHANTTSNAKRKRLSDNSDKSLFISEHPFGNAFDEHYFPEVKSMPTAAKAMLAVSNHPKILR
jgi:hypothetical protein